MLCIKNGLVHDAVTEEPKIADILRTEKSRPSGPSRDPPGMLR